jgi:hypothetical protein
MCSAAQLGPAGKSGPTESGPAVSPGSRTPRRDQDSGTVDNDATDDESPVLSLFGLDAAVEGAHGGGGASDGLSGRAVDNSCCDGDRRGHVAPAKSDAPGRQQHEIHDCTGIGGDHDSDPSFEDRSMQWHADRPGADVLETSVPQAASPEPTLSGEEEELTDGEAQAGRQRAVTLTALDQHATVTLGMGSKPVHQYCESCKAVARESPDGSCPACGATREVDTVPPTWDDVAPEEGSESWSDEEVSIEIIPIPIPGALSSSPPSSEAGSDEEGSVWPFEDSTAFFAEVHNRTGHARKQTAERRLVDPRPKTVPPEAAGSATMNPNEAPAEASTLCSQTRWNLSRIFPEPCS